MQKQHADKVNRFESKARRAETHQHRQKVERAKSRDHKHDTSVMDLMGYGKYK